MTPQQRKAAIDTYAMQAMAAHNVQFRGDFSETFVALIGLATQPARGRMSQILDEFETLINADHNLRLPPLPFVWRQHLRVIPPNPTVLDSYLNNSVSTLTLDTYHALFSQTGI